MSHTIPTDEMLSQNNKKLELDLDLIGPQKYTLEDISELTKKVVEQENQINHAISFMSEKQNEICQFLIRFNTLKSFEEKKETRHKSIAEDSYISNTSL